MTKLIKIKPTNEDMNVVLEVTPHFWKKYNRWVKIVDELWELVGEQKVPPTDPRVEKLAKEKELCTYTLRNGGFINKHYFRTSWVLA